MHFVPHVAALIGVEPLGIEVLPSLGEPLGARARPTEFRLQPHEDRAVQLGAFVSVADHLAGEDRERAIYLWERRGRRTSGPKPVRLKRDDWPVADPTLKEARAAFLKFL